MEVHLIKTHQGTLVPNAVEDLDKLRCVRIGGMVRASIVRVRNGKFHRRFFAMLNVGFDAWEPELPDHNGLPVQKNFERFRKDCIIAAGFYEPVVNLKGEVRAEAHSISFSNMDEEEFGRVYSAVADVLLQRVLRNYTRDDLDQVVDRIIGFC